VDLVLAPGPNAPYKHSRFWPYIDRLRVFFYGISCFFASCNVLFSLAYIFITYIVHSANLPEGLCVLQALISFHF